MNSKTKKKPLKVVFMGTPEFAVSSLAALVEDGHHIVGVITAPDRPAGRGMKTTESAVKKFAIEHRLNVLQPGKLRNTAFIEELRALEADLQVVVAFRMLPEIVWNMPPLGTINVHASLLPKYRGAAPINWAVINGETETGVTTFKLTHEIDTGNILLQDKIAIEESDNAGTIHDRLKIAGARLLVKTVRGIANGTIAEKPQTSFEGNATHAPKIFTETCRISWNQPAHVIVNLIRGLSPYPGAFTELEGRSVKIFAAGKITEAHRHPPGSLHTDYSTYIKIACNDGYVDVLEIQAEGKKRMPVRDFLRGFRPST